MGGAGGWFGGKAEWVFGGYGVSVWADEKVLEMNGGQWGYTQPHKIIYLKLVKRVHFMLYV